uniref:Asparagine synthetase domain-containing protein n=1 Tax=Ditylenchus dipsaci TaxID=166011 RepID=A0A915DB62_9BILA
MTIQTVMSVAPCWRRPQCAEELDGRVIEKYLLRKAFSNPRDPYLPDDILWSPKEQFDDGVGYNWTDGLKAHSEKHVTDEEMCSAPKIFPYNTPITKEGFFYRRIFAGHFRSKLASQAVQLWLPKWVSGLDPSGRQSQLHAKAFKK